MFSHQQKVNNVKQVYMPVTSYEVLRKNFDDALNSYNNSNNNNENGGSKKLFFFQNAINHLCRICRILKFPSGGNILLVGIGGKKTLSRLASFMCNFKVHEIKNQNDYNMNEFHKDLKNLFIKTGIDNQEYVLLIHESEIADEELFVPLNEFLAFGSIKNIFDDDENKMIINRIRNKLNSNGERNEKDHVIWKYFIEKVQSSLKVILCFSPLGKKFKLMIRKFPSLIYRMKIDWFHDWPESALISVASLFIDDIDVIDANIKIKIAEFVAVSHKNVNIIADDYKNSENVIYYITPNTFLKYLANIKDLIDKKSREINENIDKYTTGIKKIKDIEEEVKKLKLTLNNQDIEIAKRTVEVDKILKVKFKM